jgi:hypothetical protein
MAMPYSTPDLKRAWDADREILNKLTIVRTDAPRYGTPGPTALDWQARHAHVTNQIGVAWVYRGSPLGTDQRNSAYDGSKTGKGVSPALAHSAGCAIPKTCAMA